MKVTIPQTIIEFDQEEAEKLGRIALIACETLNSSIRVGDTDMLLIKCCVEKHQMSELRDFAERITDVIGVA